MAMTEGECSTVYRQLADTLQQDGLGWVVGQVEARVRLREAMEVAIETVRVRSHVGQTLPGLAVRPTRSQRRTETFVVTREYTPREQLIFLLDAIEQAVVNVAEMQESVMRWMENTDVSEIAFYPDEPNGDGSQLTLQQATKHRQQALVLRDTLNRLRGAIDAG